MSNQHPQAARNAPKQLPKQKKKKPPHRYIQQVQMLNRIDHQQLDQQSVNAVQGFLDGWTAGLGLFHQSEQTITYVFTSFGDKLSWNIFFRIYHLSYLASPISRPFEHHKSCLVCRVQYALDMEENFRLIFWGLRNRTRNANLI